MRTQLSLLVLLSLASACAPGTAIEESEALAEETQALVEDAEEECSADSPNLFTGCVCQGSFFDAHPVETIFTDSTGDQLPLPFATCDVTMTLLKGSADYEEVAARIEGSGFRPVRFDNGKTTMSLYFTDFGETDIGSYREFVIAYDVVPDTFPAFTLPWVNAMSSLVPAFTPGTAVYMDRLILSRVGGEQATRDGVETLGLDKRLGVAGMWHAPSHTSFFIADGGSRRILDGRIANRTDPADQLEAATALARAFGLADATQLPPSPPEQVVSLVNVDSRDPSQVWQWSAIINQPAPVMTLLKSSDNVRFGRTSSAGRMLDRMDFEPTVALRYSDADIVYPPAANWP